MANVISYAAGAFITTISHPLGYAKVLIQLGHEPLLPSLSKELLTRKERWYYPNIFKYIGHIKKRDGFLGLWRGLVPQLTESLVRTYVTHTLTEELKKQFPIEEEETGSEVVLFLRHFGIKTSREVTAKCVAIFCSHPFQVIAIRTMAQFIGEETMYNNIFSSISEIYRIEGFSGFYAGLVPRLIGEAITICLINFISDLINDYLIDDKEYKSYTTVACNFAVSQITYPFVLVSRIMCVNNSGLAAASPPYMIYYADWRDCWTNLKKTGELNRGSSMFWRACPGLDRHNQMYNPPIDSYRKYASF
ncbi:mitochondrial carrier homolog 2-like [Saccostrea echinata]|uniref:mitochondrial carrier homolog 2-like n=1 Tax=Saccostrea echinata TaxID=191078 RepID=UPI002A81FD13|nr:mitochondrial carrier homolog 2-like [Saccostrea echinata]